MCVIISGAYLSLPFALSGRDFGFEVYLRKLENVRLIIDSKGQHYIAPTPKIDHPLHTTPRINNKQKVLKTKI